jgi:hypothetical protein
MRPELVNLSKAESTFQIRCRDVNGGLYINAKDLLEYLNFNEDVGAAVYMVAQACREQEVARDG